MSPSVSRLVSFALLARGAAGAASWPTKTVDTSIAGSACDPSTEQYLKVQVYDYHDHPKFSVTWRQVMTSDGKSFTGSYDADAGDSPTTGKVQLNLFVCAPHGDYELELDIDSYSDQGSTLQQRTSWAILNGDDERQIWNTDSTELASNEELSPRLPGSYVWPMRGTEDFYSVFKVGPVLPVEFGTNEAVNHRRLGEDKDAPDPRKPEPKTPAPTPAPTKPEPESPEPHPTDYEKKGCYKDSKRKRIMSYGGTGYPMSAEVRVA